MAAAHPRDEQLKAADAAHKLQELKDFLTKAFTGVGKVDVNATLESLGHCRVPCASVAELLRMTTDELVRDVSKALFQQTV